MGRLLDSIFGLRKNERGMALLMALYHFLLLITLYLLKPVRDSLFLSERGPDELPFVFILTTLAVAPIAFLHGRAARRLHVGRLIDGVSVALIGCLGGLYWLLTFEAAWSSYVLYAWVSIYGLLITSQFWLLANAVFTASQAKRIFTVLSIGAILGAVVGGEITGLLVDQLGLDSTALLWVTAGILGASTVLVRWIRYRHVTTGGTIGDGSAEADAPSKATGAWDIIRSSTHVRNIVGIIVLTVITTTFVDYQFKTVASQAFTTEGGLTSFMGRFYGRVSLVALLIQFVVAPRLMRVVGVGGALALLPTFLALGAAAMIIVPGLVAGILLRGADQSLKHSVDKTGRELLFVPVSLEKKKRVKVFLDLFVDQGAQGLGGALLLLFTVALGLQVQVLSVVTLGLLAVWGVFVYRARDSYVDQFRTKLREQEDYVESEGETAADTSKDLDDLLRSLCGHNEADALQALEKLEASDITVPVDALLCLFRHPSAAVREKALVVLRVRKVTDVASEVAELVTDPDPDVQLAAAKYLYCNLTGNRLDRLREVLQHEDLRVRGAAVGLIAEEGGTEEFQLVNLDLVRRLMDAEGDVGEDARTHLARLYGVVDRAERNEMLTRLLHDSSAQVVRAATRAAGKTGDRRFVHTLVQHLGTEAYEAEARTALAMYGRRIIGTLFDHLVDDTVDRVIRRRIPSILVVHPCQNAVTILGRSLERLSFDLRHPAIRSLSKLHAAGDFTFETERIEDAIYREAEHFAMLGKILYLARRGRSRASETVDPDVLQRYREESLERIFRLLGLRYNQRDIYDAYLGITSADASLRSSAVEFVDNLVEYGISRYLVPLLDDPEGRQARMSKEFDRSIRRWDDAWEYLDAVDDPRLGRGEIRGPYDEADVDSAEPGRDPAVVEDVLDAATAASPDAVATRLRDGESGDAGGDGAADPASRSM